MAVVVTGIGLMTPLGMDPVTVLRRMESGEKAAVPHELAPGAIACPVWAPIKDFEPKKYVPEGKLLRLMNREAQLAVAAARLALEDASLKAGADYQPGEIALFGATGLAGLPLEEVLPLIKASVGSGAEIDLERFGKAGLRSISPLLSFKILPNMPSCFVSICENIQGPNCIYTPWEGQGAQAVAAGMEAIAAGRARAALVGGCDVKTHLLALITLQQQGVFVSWQATQKGTVPGEGASFLVLEEARAAQSRGARIYARLAKVSLGSRSKAKSRSEAYLRTLKTLGIQSANDVVSSADEDGLTQAEEMASLQEAGIQVARFIHPKQYVGNLFAAAAALQTAIGALLAQRNNGSVLVNCFGHGTQYGAFLLEANGGAA